MGSELTKAKKEAQEPFTSKGLLESASTRFLVPFLYYSSLKKQFPRSFSGKPGAGKIICENVI